MPSTRSSKYSAGVPLGLRPERPSGRLGLDAFALRGLDSAQVAVERERALAVLDDDEIAVAGELTGERDHALVDDPDGLAFGDADLDAVPDDGRAEAAARLAAEA